MIVVVRNQVITASVHMKETRAEVCSTVGL